MPNKVNKLIKETINNNDIYKNNSSFKNAKEFKKINENNVMPRMLCNVKLVQKFRNLAKERQWSNTTLMNNILKDYFDKLKNNNNEDY
ncbi:hypothetical protein [Spiroplasma endosymbiont of Megaselia nigra]|uniref:hypothetical protein n=1 Tax=Spiroplasma endosymbiont of Megaselia nigra TaxID=2478537 RepID=UPI000F88833E|nr:hypothetical protein [Spiroplasma endosymbiont of Megaselia nigra]RUO86064.1 hypothetical protein D9R21_05255 [Spiroplasma endosymbiont of Megaselia nigra]